MKISIIIPVYNVKEYLEDCVASVLQMKAEKEIVLVDDGSTDGSGELCDALGKVHGEVAVIHQKNGGLSAARNTGIRHSTGDFVMFLDSDDFIDPVETDAMLRGLKEETQVAMGLYQNYYAAEKKTEPESGEGFLQLSGIVPMERFLEAIPADGQSCYMIACRFLVRREFLLAHELFFLPGIYHEDEEWTHRLLCAAQTMQVFHQYFYYYRQAREGAITSTVKSKHLKDGFQIIERAEKLLLPLSADPARAQYLRQRMANIYMNSMIHVYRFSEEERETILQQLKKYKDLCTPYLPGKAGKVAGFCVRLVGLNATCRLLHRVWLLKKREGKE